MKTWKIKVHLVAQEVFQYSLITYLILMLAETIKQGFVTAYFNINILLGVVVISGAMMALTYTEGFAAIIQKPHRLTADDVQNSFVLATIGAIIVYFKMQEMGMTGIIISVLTGAILIFLSILVLAEE